MNLDREQWEMAVACDHVLAETRLDDIMADLEADIGFPCQPDDWMYQTTIAEYQQAIEKLASATRQYRRGLLTEARYQDYQLRVVLTGACLLTS